MPCSVFIIELELLQESVIENSFYEKYLPFSNIGDCSEARNFKPSGLSDLWIRMQFGPEYV